MVKIIKTKSFQLAVYLHGSSNAKKIAILLPGRLDTKDYQNMRSHVDYLASKRYLSISFDPPGTWESKGSIRLYTMTNYLKAINELIEYFNNKPTILMGHSRGGSMAMLAGTRNKYVTHIISIMSCPTPSSISDKIKEKGFEISYRDNPSGVKRKFELPLEFFKDALKYDMLDALSKCIKPKLFIFGAKDDIVTPQTVKDAYERSAEPKQLFGVNCGHNYRLYPKIIDEINKVVGKFLDENS